MKTLVAASLFGIMACNSALTAPSSGTMDGFLEQFMSSPHKAFTSGTASMIRGVYKKAIREEDLLMGHEFADEKQKKEFLRRVRVDLTAQEDRLTHTFERLYFHGVEKRRDFAKLQPAEVATLRRNPSAAEDLNYQVITFNPKRTVTRLNSDIDGGVRRSALVKTGEIYFPSFARFGTTHGAQSGLSESRARALESGTGKISRSEVDGKIRLVYKLGQGVNSESDRPAILQLERIFDPDKDMALLYAARSRKGTLVDEKLFSDHTQLDDGQWYPLKATFNRYVEVNGENTLVEAETFEVVEGTVQFNKPIDPTVFSPPFEDGTNVIDYRYKPALTFRVDSPSVGFSPETLDVDTALAPRRGAETTKVFLPKIDPNGPILKPFVLDLASGKLLLVHAKNAKNRRRAENMLKIRLGDLAWDGTLLFLRELQLVPPPDAAGRLMDCSQVDWCESCTLPQDIGLPYSFTVLSHEKENFRVTIHEIIPTGIWLSYQKTDAL